MQHDIIIQTNLLQLRGFAILVNDKAYAKIRAAWAKQTNQTEDTWSLAPQAGWHQVLVAIGQNIGDPKTSAHAQAKAFRDQFPEFSVKLIVEGKSIEL